MMMLHLVVLFTLLPQMHTNYTVFCPGFNENLALAAIAVQSSLYNDQGHAINAIDGNSNPDYMKGSCTHTQIEDNPWWRLELPEAYIINKVVVTNRGDCCAHRLDGAQIHIGNSLQKDGNDNKRVATITSLESGATETYTFTPTEGRFVNIYRPGVKAILTLCEVQVYGVNLAIGGKAVQSSLYDNRGKAENAIDGNSNSDYNQASCTHTRFEDNPWWRLELPKTYVISRVVITNRGYCCGARLNGAQIRIGESLDNNGNNNDLVASVNFLPGGATGTYAFTPTTGRFVNIFIPRSQAILSLCEVKVFGADLDYDAI